MDAASAQKIAEAAVARYDAEQAIACPSGTGDNRDNRHALFVAVSDLTSAIALVKRQDAQGPIAEETPDPGLPKASEEI